MTFVNSFDVSFEATTLSETFVTRIAIEFDAFMNRFFVSAEAGRVSETFVT